MIPGKSEEEQSAKTEAKIAGEEKNIASDDNETLKQAFAEQKTKAESYLAGWQRAQADFENYKKRSDQEKEELGKFANSALILSLLPVLDDLERAFSSMPPTLAELSWVDGFRLIGRKLQAGLESQGLSPIKAVGERFDPNFHEAAMHGHGEEGMIVAELQKGYKFRDRVIRPSVVVVGDGKKGETKKAKPEE